MKIAFVADVAYPWHIGGTETLNRNEAKALAAEHDVDFFSMQWPGMRSEFREDGIRYHALAKADEKSLYINGRRSIAQALSFSLSLSRLFRYDFDVIISNQFPVLHLPVLYLYCRAKRCRLIMEVVEVWDKRYWISYLGPVLGRIGSLCYSLTLRGADHYIANSSTTAERLAAAGVERGRVSVFAPIIDDKLVDSIRASRGKGRGTIVFSGRLIKEKRMGEWLQIIRGVNKEVKVSAVIIGSGPERDQVRSEIAKLGLKRVVEVRDFFRTRRELYKQLKDATALLLMSEREGLGVIAVESLALGTPVFLPLDSPVPDEVKGMCVVDEEGELTTMLIDLMRSGRKSDYIKDRKSINAFRVSAIPRFYNSLFSKLGLR